MTNTLSSRNHAYQGAKISNLVISYISEIETFCENILNCLSGAQSINNHVTHYFLAEGNKTFEFVLLPISILLYLFALYN